MDRTDRKFIEVKVTLDKKRALNDYDLSAVHHLVFTALCMVNPATLEIEWRDHNGNSSGEDKVRTFLATRRAMMDKLGIMESPSHEVYDLDGFVFISKRFIESTEEWIRPLWKLTDQPKMNLCLDEEPTADEVTPLLLMKNLEDPRTGKGNNFVKWEGKVLPPQWCDEFYSEGDTDETMVSEFLTNFNWANPDDGIHGGVLNRIKTEWEKQSVKSTFKFLSPRELGGSSDHESLRKMLGIGAKKAVRDDNDNTTKQPESKEHKKLTHHPWFDELMEDLTKNHENPGHYSKDLATQESPSDHPMDVITRRCFGNIVGYFSESWIGAYSNKVTNLYSRLGGSYLGDNQGNPNHSFISIFPLYSISTEESGEKFRAIQGICVRAPHHASSPTDRVNFITIEKVREDPRTRAYLPFVKAGHLITDLEGGSFPMRSNSIKKTDPAHLTFTESSLFVVSNMAGELILNGLSDEKPEFDPRHPELWLAEHSLWLKDRMVEGILNATLGGSQEEGAFAIVRKLFMIMMAWSRGKRVVMWNPTELCEKLNECLLDHPLAMHYACSVIDIIRQQFLPGYTPPV